MSDAESTPSKKNLIAPSFDFWSPFFQPESRNIGAEASSMPINKVSISLDEATTSAPRRELSSK
jgi:hypothetical protein